MPEAGSREEEGALRVYTSFETGCPGLFVLE